MGIEFVAIWLTFMLWACVCVSVITKRNCLNSITIRQLLSRFGTSPKMQPSFAHAFNESLLLFFFTWHKVLICVFLLWIHEEGVQVLSNQLNAYFYLTFTSISLLHFDVIMMMLVVYSKPFEYFWEIETVIQ